MAECTWRHCPFDRGAIEIRVLDIQECPGGCGDCLADYPCCRNWCRALGIAGGAEIWEAEKLRGLFQICIAEGEQAVICDSDYLRVFHLPQNRACAGELWRYLLEQVREGHEQEYRHYREVFEC